MRKLGLGLFVISLVVYIGLLIRFYPVAESFGVLLACACLFFPTVPITAITELIAFIRNSTRVIEIIGLILDIGAAVLTAGAWLMALMLGFHGDKTYAAPMIIVNLTMLALMIAKVRIGKSKAKEKTEYE